MRSAIPLIAEARKAAGLPRVIVDLEPNCPEKRGMKAPQPNNFPDGVVPHKPDNPNFKEVEAMGGTVLASNKPRAGMTPE